MLKLELTDGSKTVTAMEVKPIPSLNTKLPPGTKIQFIGPIKVVNKVVFLEPKNVKVLGGEVDTLLITNAYENVLLRALKKPLTAKPKVDYFEEPVAVEPERRPLNIQPKLMEKRVQKPFQPKPKPQPIQSRTLFDDEDEEFLSLDLDSLTGVKPPKLLDEYSDDDDMMQLENDFLKASETKSSSKKEEEKPAANKYENLPNQNVMMEVQETPQIKTITSEALFDDDEDFDGIFAQIDSLETASASSNQPSTSSSYFPANAPKVTTPVSSKFSKFKKIQETPPKKPRFEEPTIVEPPKKKICDIGYPYKIREISISTIDQYLELTQDERKNRMFIFYGSFDRLWRPLKVKNEEWVLGCIFKDDYSDGELKVLINSQLLNKIAGCNAREFSSIKSESAVKPQLFQDVEKVN
jgi:RecQ-mediated genome instability protein 1